MDGIGEFVFTPEELDSLFGVNEQETPPVEEQSNESTPAEKETDEASKVETTKAFAKRLAEKTAKAKTETREEVAKEMGYSSYAEMISSKEKKVLEDNGLDPDVSSKAIDEIVKMRIDSDPRIKELEEYRAAKVKEFGKQQLAEITQLTGGEITSLDQLSKEVIDLWKTTGSLKQAYLQVEGENLITKIRSGQSQGNTTHMAMPSKSSPAIDQHKRTLTDEEKSAWKIFYPNMTDEELNKMIVDK